MDSILVISGLDPCGGAGFCADVRVAEMHGLRAVGVVTALTEQDTTGVRAVHPVPAAVLGDQLRALLSDVEVAAVKIGMLGSEAIAAQVADALDAVGPAAVWDPVLRPTAGSVLLYDGDAAHCAKMLARHVGVVTPNVPEAEILSGQSIANRDDMRRAAEAIGRLMGERVAILVKGGHLDGDKAVDILATASGVVDIESDRVALTASVHGTGCVLSTALACELARSSKGATLERAVEAAKQFVTARLTAPERPGRGAPTAV